MATGYIALGGRFVKTANGEGSTSDPSVLSVALDSSGLAVTADTELTTADLDTGAGTDTRAVVGVVLAASGGAVAQAGGAGAVNTGTQRVTLGSDDPAVAGIGGTGDASVSAGATGSVNAKLRRLTTDLDAVKTSVAAATPAGTNTIGGTLDAGPSWTPVHGVTAAPVASADASSVVSVTDAPTSGQKIVVTDLIFSVGSTAMNVTFKCETSGAIITGPYYCQANTSYQFTPRSLKAWKLATADKKLQVLASVAGNIMVDAHYYSEA